MTAKVELIRVFVSSPADLKDERVRLEEVVRELNTAWGDKLGMRVELSFTQIAGGGMNTYLFEILKELFVAWREGNRRVRIAIVIAVLLLLAGGLIFVVSRVLSNESLVQVGKAVSAALAGTGALITLVIYGLQRSKEEVKQEKKIEAVEKRVQENPKETQVAWELARRKLESYLNRNLSQVRSIFFSNSCGHGYGICSYRHRGLSGFWRS